MCKMPLNFIGNILMKNTGSGIGMQRFQSKVILVDGVESQGCSFIIYIFSSYSKIKRNNEVSVD